MLYTEHFLFNAFQERCSVVWDSKGHGIIVDPGFADAEEREELYGFITHKRLNISAILLTHAHFDHIFGLKESAERFSVPVYMHKAEEAVLNEANPYLCGMFGLPVPDKEIPDGTIRYISDGDVISIGEMRFEVIGTPGHTPGGVCYLERGARILFSGDTLFAGSIGRTDNRWGDYDRLMEGIFGKLMTLDGEIRVIPGHGSESDIATERATNPFLMPFNEPFEEQI